MIRVSAAFGTRFFGMPIPLPVMTLFMREGRSCVRLRVECKEIVARKPVFPATELTHHLRTALVDHLLKLACREKRQRSQGPFAAARAGVTERNVEAGVDLLVLTSVENSRDHVFDGHLVEQSAQRRRLFDALLDAVDRIRTGVWKALDDDAARGRDAIASIEDAEKHGGRYLLRAREIARQILRNAATFERDLRRVRLSGRRRAANDSQQAAADGAAYVEVRVQRHRVRHKPSRRPRYIRLGDDHAERPVALEP